MAETATYELHVDWDNNGNFTTAGDDISADVQSVTIDRGFYGPLGRVAAVGRLTVVLDNQGQTYSPELDADIVPRRPVRFRMTYNSTTVVKFRGFLEEMRPEGGQYLSRRAVMECVDAMALLDTHEAVLAVQENAYADDIIDAVVDAIYTPPSTNYQAGLNLFPVSGEKWTLHPVWGQSLGPYRRERINGTQKITDAATADWGRFFIAQDGAPTYYNRHQTPLDSTADLTLNDTMLNLSYAKGERDIYNHVEVTCHPRKVSASDEVLARIPPERPERIGASSSRTFVLDYRDPANQAIRVGGFSVNTPVADTDYTATSDEAGEGTDLTASVQSASNNYADRAEVTLTNNASQPVWIQRLQVRGRAVRTREPATAQKTDSTSISAYGRRKLPVDAVLMNTMPDADRLAEYLLDVHKDPRPRVERVVINGNRNATLMAAVRDLELLDRVDVTETQTGLSGFEGFIYRMTHRIDNKFRHTLTVDLEQAYQVGTPFRLDTSALNSGHELLY